MKMKYFNGKELDDAKIIETLSKVVSMYDNGEIAEVRDELSEIVNAIDEFERQYNMKE
jgi:hypothetical protein